MVVRYTPKDKFVTLFYGVYDQSNNQFEYATAGHNYPIWLRGNGEYKTLSKGGPALGLTEDARYLTGKVNLSERDVVLFYTDGVTETMNETKDQYGEKRLSKLLIQNRNLDSNSMVAKILKDLDCFSNSDVRQDDSTIMVLKI